MNIIYTITSNNYSKFTCKCLKSFLINCSTMENIKFYVLSPHEIKDKVLDDRIEYLNLQGSIPKNVFSLGVKTQCKWLKTKALDFIPTNNVDWLIYSDSDVLFFKNFNEILERKDENKFHISYDGARSKFQNLERNKYRFCSGFLFFKPKIFPNILREWEEKVLERMVDKPKLLDQPSLIEILKTKYSNNCQSIPLDEVSYKVKRDGAYITHYINKKYKRFESNFFDILSSQNSELINHISYMTNNFKGIKEWKYCNGFSNIKRDNYKLLDISEKIDYFIDIGSCLGEVSFIVKKKFGNSCKVFAIESNPETFEYCKENLSCIDVSVFNYAISDNDNDLCVCLHAGGDIGGSKTKIDSSGFIKTISFNSFLKDNNIDINKNCVLKIDCDGCEKHVFKDIEILKKFYQIICEIHNYRKNKEFFDNFIEKIKDTHNVISKPDKLKNTFEIVFREIA